MWLHKPYNISSDAETSINKNSYIIDIINTIIRIHAQIQVYYKIYILKIYFTRKPERN